MSSMHFSLALLIGASATGFSPRAQESDSAPRPNVLILLADDLGWMDVGFNNPSTFYDTPNLDRLCAQGARLSAAYAACPVCSPTRASLMTGKHPARMDTTDWFGAPQPDAILAAADEGAKRLARFQKLALLPAPYVAALPLEEVTIAEVLKGAGYATFFAGKWHLGGQGFEPERQGFDVNVAGHHRGGPYGPGRYFHPFGMPNLESEEGDHLPARLAEETSAFIDDHASEPWFATLSFYSVHTPLMGRPDLVERYEAKRTRLEEAGELEDEWGREGDRRVRSTQNHAVYAAMVAAMDEAVGEVLDTLDERGLAEDTLVIFFSDNGGLSTSEGHPTSNLPLRGGKGWLYEGGIREPCTVRWPGRIQAGRVIDTPVQSVDFLPTIAAAAGIESEDWPEVDGVDLTSLLGRDEGTRVTSAVLALPPLRQPRRVPRWRDPRRWLEVDRTLRRRRRAVRHRSRHRRTARSRARTPRTSRSPRIEARGVARERRRQDAEGEPGQALNGHSLSTERVVDLSRHPQRVEQ